MGIFSFLNPFKKKPEEKSRTEEISKMGLSSPYSPALSYVQPPAYGTPPSISSPSMSSEFATSENIKSKLDLLLTQIDSMRIQHEAMNEKLNQIEKMLREIFVGRRY